MSKNKPITAVKPRLSQEILEEKGFTFNDTEIRNAKKDVARKKREISLVKVTPSLATLYLSKSINSHNRQVYMGHVERIAKAIQDGEWETTNEVPAFDKEGNLLDGQHRFMAVVLSGLEVEMFIGFGFDKDIFDVIGQGKPRSVSDVIFIKHHTHKSWGSVASAMNGGGTTSATRGSVRNQIEHFEQHLEAIEWVMTKFPHARGISRAAVPAVFARAWYTCKRQGKLETLKRAIEVLRTGEIDSPDEKGLIKLRNYLINHNLAGHMASCKAYRKVEFVLDRYLRGQAAGALVEVSKELFPTPYDKKEDAVSPALPRSQKAA